MKKWFFSCMFGLLLTGFMACDNDAKTTNDTASDDISVDKVPQAVQSAFTAKYPGASDVKWETATENNTATYKVKFTMNDKKMKVEYGKDGSFIKEDD